MTIDARLSFGAIEMILEDSTEAPLCWEGEHGIQADCPSDGAYQFAGNYTMVNPPSDFLGWAVSGYSGKIIITFTVSGEKAGECTMSVKTRRSTGYSTENRDIRDVKTLNFSGQETTLTTLGIIVGLLGLWLFVQGVCQRRDLNTKDYQTKESSALPFPMKQDTRAKWSFKRPNKNVVPPRVIKQPLITPLDDDPVVGEMV
jgi:hypothetical protein